jgi:hypothetical protein
VPVQTVRLADLGRTIGRDMRAQRDAAQKAMRITVHTEAPRIIQDEIARAQPRQPVDTGGTKNKYQTRDVPGGVIVFNPSVAAAVIEDGRRAGKMPPLEPLIRWVLRKGLVGKAAIMPSEKGKHARAAARLVAKDVEWQAAKGIAWAIARKMMKQGWPAAPNQPMQILAKTAARLRPLVLAAVDRALRGDTP